MIAIELPARTAMEVGRVVRALGGHRYVAGRLHLTHALAFEALRESASPVLAEACAWARAVLEDTSIQRDSKDERLWRASTEGEIAAVLEGYWSREGASARASLENLLREASIDIPSRPPFDETIEEDIFPVLIDAGWELLPLAKLDAERHKGAIQSFGEQIDFEVARFDEESAIDPIAYLQELPAIGCAELLRGATEDGELLEPLNLWIAGNETYHDYVVRGVLRAAKLSPA